jgi:hypothetical protein
LSGLLSAFRCSVAEMNVSVFWNSWKSVPFVGTLQALPQCIHYTRPLSPFSDKLQSVTPDLHNEQPPEVYTSNARRCPVIHAAGSPRFGCRSSRFDGPVWLPSVATHRTSNPAMTFVLQNPEQLERH